MDFEKNGLAEKNGFSKNEFFKNGFSKNRNFKILKKDFSQNVKF